MTRNRVLTEQTNYRPQARGSNITRSRDSFSDTATAHPDENVRTTVEEILRVEASDGPMQG